MSLTETDSIAENCGQIYKNEVDTKQRADALKIIFQNTPNKDIRLLPFDTHDQAMMQEDRRLQRWKNRDAVLNKGFKAGLNQQKTDLPVSDSEIIQLSDKDISERFDGQDCIAIMKKKKALNASFARLRKKIYKLWELNGFPKKTDLTTPSITVIKSSKELQEGQLDILNVFFSTHK